MVVQFEVDACLPEEQWQSTTSTSDEELINAMANMGLSTQNQQASSSSASTSTSPESRTTEDKSEVFGLKVHHQGRADIPNSAIIELATKSSAGIGWSDRYPQLYLSQTGNHHMGNRRKGTFIRIDKFTRTSPELSAAHERLQPIFKKLEEALSQIQSIVMEHGQDERLSLVYEKPNLTVRRNLTSQSCFPPEALELFN
jgi:hypothetical protein